MNLNRDREPILKIVGGLGSLLACVLGLLVSFGIDLDENQIGAIIALGGSVSSLVLAWLGRQHVYPVSTVEDQFLEAEHGLTP